MDFDNKENRRHSYIEKRRKNVEYEDDHKIQKNNEINESVNTDRYAL